MNQCLLPNASDKLLSCSARRVTSSSLAANAVLAQNPNSAAQTQLMLTKLLYCDNRHCTETVAPDYQVDCLRRPLIAPPSLQLPLMLCAVPADVHMPTTDCVLKKQASNSSTASSI